MPDPQNDKESIEVDELTGTPNTVPVPIQSLVDEGFRAVKVVAGDSISAAISDQGELRVWGTFRGCSAVSKCVFRRSGGVVRGSEWGRAGSWAVVGGRVVDDVAGPVDA